MGERPEVAYPHSIELKHNVKTNKYTIMSTVPNPPAINGRFTFFSGLTVEGTGIFSGGPFLITAPAVKTPKLGIFIANNSFGAANWDVRQTAAIQNEGNGLVLDCPDFRRDPGVQVVQFPFNEGTNQQWDFQLVKTAQFGQFRFNG
ncbi:MAG: ricin-type beta-trefoil lectin domain protein [Verrucomicrobia bacterium]|nr:ricin-type beta-trefoil lectin domain protein [Verrucomicrobiota bacterium]